MTESEKKAGEFRLIDNILAGERDGYRVLVERYSSMVFYVVRRFERDEDEVKELAQQIFVKAYEKLGGFDKNSSFSTWLYRLAANHCRDYVKNIRRKNSRLSELEPAQVDECLQEEQTPFLNLEWKEWAAQLKMALKAISKDYADPFLMKYRDGMSYQAISEQTGVTVSALKVRVHRARKELKSRLEKQVL
jgi:RNA polymerase sigma-70 factor, ECF subfamily